MIVGTIQLRIALIAACAVIFLLLCVLAWLHNECRKLRREIDSLARQLEIERDCDPYLFSFPVYSRGTKGSQRWRLQ
jgi:hypothetical protein